MVKGDDDELEFSQVGDRIPWTTHGYQIEGCRRWAIGLRPVFTQCSQNSWIGDSKINLMDEEDDNTCNVRSLVYSHGAARIPWMTPHLISGLSVASCQVVGNRKTNISVLSSPNLGPSLLCYLGNNARNPHDQEIVIGPQHHALNLLCWNYLVLWPLYESPQSRKSI